MGKESNYVNGRLNEEKVFKDLKSNNNTPVTNEIKKMIGEVKNIENTGRNFKIENGDFIINGKVVEIKQVASGTGTYLNSSIYNMEKLGLPVPDLTPIRVFLAEKNVNTLNGKNILNKEIAKEISTNEWYKEFKQIDENIRRDYTKQIFDIFLKNGALKNKFIHSVLTKEISNKKTPDFLIIENTAKSKIFSIKKEEIENSNCSDLENSGLGINFGYFRIAFSWQNRIGNNLTMRVFING